MRKRENPEKNPKIPTSFTTIVLLATPRLEIETSIGTLELCNYTYVASGRHTPKILDCLCETKN